MVRCCTGTRRVRHSAGSAPGAAIAGRDEQQLPAGVGSGGQHAAAGENGRTVDRVRAKLSRNQVPHAAELSHQSDVRGAAEMFR